MSSSKRFCFTINNYSDDDINRLKNCGYSFITFGKEIGENGTPHLQGYIEFKSSKRFSTLKKFLPRAHIESAKASSEDNISYCGKDGDIFTDGTPKKQGCRTDLNKIKDEIINGKKLDDITMEEPTIFHQYGRTLSKIEDLVMRRKFRTEMTTCDWLYGPTGTGKSHAAFKDFTPDTHYVWKSDNGWQDGYAQQPTVLINDFRGEIPYNELLQMIDKWPYYVKRRGREPMPFTSKHIIITSSLPPDAIYHRRLEEDSLEQLNRRINLVFCGGSGQR